MKKKNNKKFLYVFASCIPVKGAKRSLICDIQRNRFHLIPNVLFEIIGLLKTHSIVEVKNMFDEKNHETIEEYFEFLIKNELAVFCDDISRFPPIDIDFESPIAITDFILDTGENSNHDYKKIFEELETLGCISLQLRFYSQCNFQELDTILSFIYDSRLKSAELILKYSNEWNLEAVEKLMHEHSRVFSVYIHSSPIDRFIHNENTLGLISYKKEVVDSPGLCGKIQPEGFVCNLEFFKESVRFNNCLNKKISIDMNGEIKNCPSMSKSYGSIKDTSLRSVINNNEFKKYWTINKDKIEVCNICEFRYVCSDCRVFVNDPENIFSKPSKCGYDPYHAKWLAAE